MAEATAFSLSKFFSELTGQHVSFAIATNAPAPKGDQMYGLYHVIADARPMLMRMSLSSIALMGGALLGIPADLAIERVRAAQVDESLTDAMHEVLNIASTAFSPDERIVFKGMSRTVDVFPAEVKDWLQKASRKSSYRVAVNESTAELLTLAR